VPVDERVRQQRLVSLRLSRSRIEQQLSRATHPAHRETLMKALQAIEDESEQISREVPENS